MFPALILSLSLLAAPTFATPPDASTSSPVTSTLASAPSVPTPWTSDRDEREWAANRPNRGASRNVSVVLRAATVPRVLVPFASCVIARESGGTLDRRQSGAAARNPSSSASGRWQFLDRSWRKGLSFMVRDRLVRFGLPKAQAREVREWLAAHPIYQWHGLYQDAGFLEVVQRGGRHHWNGGSHSC